MISRVFQPSIYKSDLKRMWIYPFLYGIGLLLFEPYLISSAIGSAGLRSTDSLNTATAFAMGTICDPFVSSVIGLVAALCVFSYLYSTKSAYMLHSFPVTRLSLFGTAIASGLTYMIVPKFVCTIAAHIFMAGKGYGGAAGVWLIFFEGVLIDLFFFSLAVAVILCCGRTVSAVMIYWAVNFLYMLLKVLVYSLAERVMYSVSLSELLHWDDNVITPMSYMGSRLLDFDVTGYKNDVFAAIAGKNIGMAAGYGIAGAALLCIAFLIYRFRNLESAGSFLSMEWTKPVVRWVGAFGVGGYVTLFLIELGDSDSVDGSQSAFAFALIWMVIACAVSFIVFQMMIERSLRIFSKRRLAELAVFAVVIIAGMTLMHIDPMARSGYVPETQDIELVGLYHDQVAIIDDKEDIEEVRELHKKLIASKREVLQNYDANRDEYSTITIAYVLKNKNVISRDYYVVSSGENTSLSDEALEIMKKPELVKRAFFGMEPEKNGFDQIGVINVQNGEEEYITKDAELSALYEAILADISEGNISYSDYGDDIYYLEIVFDTENGSRTYSELETQLFDYSWLYQPQPNITINRKAVHTLAALKKLGIVQ